MDQKIILRKNEKHMKTYINYHVIITVLVVILSCSACSKKETGQPDVVCSMKNNRDEMLTVIANRDKIHDKDKFAEHLLQMYKDNAFDSMLLSVDMGYPRNLEMQVYAWKDDIGKKDPIMIVVYKTDERGQDYDIVNTPEKYQLYIDGKIFK